MTKSSGDKNIRLGKRSLISYFVIVVSLSVFLVVSGPLSSSFISLSYSPIKIKQIVAQQQSSSRQHQQQQQFTNYRHTPYSAIGTPLPPPSPYSSTYPTKENSYECQKGPFEGFFVSSPEFCDTTPPPPPPSSSSKLLPSTDKTINQSSSSFISTNNDTDSPLDTTTTSIYNTTGGLQSSSSIPASQLTLSASTSSSSSSTASKDAGYSAVPTAPPQLWTRLRMPFLEFR